MKKIMLLLAVLSAVSFANAQNPDLQKWANKENAYNSSKNVTTKKTANVIRDAGFYLEKAANYQYGAISCAGVGAGLAITAAIIGTKTYENEDLTKITDNLESDRKLRKVLFIGAGISFVSAICCEFTAIKYKMKAGRSLRLYSTGNGGGLAYTF